MKQAVIVHAMVPWHPADKRQAPREPPSEGKQTMKRAFAFGVIVAAAGMVLAAPVPAETRKPAAFPAGHYVLTGCGEPGRGEDVLELTKPFHLRPGQYVLSGGSKPTDLIFVDDDLEVYQDKAQLFIDDDHVRTTETRGKRAARYKGEPIVLVLDSTKKVRIVAIDCGPTEAIIGSLWLHRWDGERKKLTDGVTLASPPNLPAAFFDESYTLTEGFEMPEKVSTDATIDLPAKPATLLPRFKSVAPPVAVKVREINPGDFVYHAVLDGLTEDGVSPLFAAALTKHQDGGNPDFLGKCTLCTPTLRAIEEYSGRKEAAKPKEGKGMTLDLARRLESKESGTRRAVIRELVAGYMDRAYAQTTISAEQRQTLEKELMKMRSVPKGGDDGLKFCPSCDGACRLLPPKP
jgi:hypothetical protein